VSTINESQFAAQLGISVTQLWGLRRNSQFPTPQTVDPQGQNSAYNTTVTAPFVAIWNQAVARWKVSSLLASGANISAMAAANPGSYYATNRQGTDPLWDL
jgi:hypothetical protein